MENTPLQDTPEVSDYLTGTFGSSSGYESHSYNSSSYVETPTTSLNVSRKRKFHQSFITERKHKLQQDSTSISPLDFENHGTHLYFLSSTLNESITNKLEKCTIKNFTPNFYTDKESSPVQYYSTDLCSKRQKINEEEEYQPKSRSAPSTPTKQICESHSPIFKSKSEHLENNYTPTKHTITRPLGSPESNKILYSNIPEKTFPKPKTPQKLIESLKKVNSPAKKRLFDDCHRKPFKKIDRDPMSVFRLKNNCPRIVALIFEFLSEVDLYHVSMVSKTWKSALISDEKAFCRYIRYVDDHKNNKENILKKLPNFYTALSPPCSPERENFQKCTKLVSTLRSSQSLLKCPRCFNLAVVEKNIGQCQNVLCQYIWCRNCSSFSITGPEDFHDKCQKSELVLAAPVSRQKLLDISNATNNNVNTDSMPAFLMDSSPGPVYLSGSKWDSSGYMSENDVGSPGVPRSAPTATLTGKDKSNILKDCNRNSSSSLRRSRRSSLLSVVDSNTPKIVEIVEPSSPPKVKNVACSRQSKKNLKRLKF